MFVIQEVAQAGNVLLVIDELHTIIGAGGAEGANAVNAINCRDYIIRVFKNILDLQKYSEAEVS